MSARLSRIARSAQQYGFKDAAADLLVQLSARTFSHTYRKRSVPQLWELSEAASSVYLTADEAIQQVALEGNTVESQQLHEEYTSLLHVLRARRADTSLAYPVSFQADEEAALLIYYLVRLRRPETVLETGVADGISTFFITNALLKNGHGVLHSIDPDPHAGVLVYPPERSCWRFRQLDSQRLLDDFVRYMKTIPEVDIFFHDSDHTYRWQWLEYTEAYKRLKNGGILASDDTNASYAFLDFCKRVNTKPMLLVGKRKVFGMLTRPSR
jgi:predicted O-methyltransferase YrrM